MLRPRKKYTVYDLQNLKGKRCLTHIHVKSPDEARAAELAGIDLMSVVLTLMKHSSVYQRLLRLHQIVLSLSQHPMVWQAAKRL